MTLNNPAPTRICSILCAALCCVLICSSSAIGDPDLRNSELPGDLSTVDLKSLLNFDLVVTSPAKKEQRISDSASAIYVLTSEDIRRSGATHIAEVLRLVPGVDVARISSNKWAISIRGFNQLFANKLLVLIDGVSLFSPTTNGVYWESNELDLDDIDQIEVIRGPGAALWGSNAVNGIINIITKNSKKTLGAKVSVGGGTHERALFKARYGGAIGEDSFYRVYGLGSKREENRLLDSSENADDEWESYAGGFRFDSEPSLSDRLNLSFDRGYQSDIFAPNTPSTEPPFIDPARFRGDSSYHNTRALAKWTHNISELSSVDTSLSYLQKKRATRLATFEYDIWDFEAQNRIQPWSKHDIVYGLSYRYFANETMDSAAQEVTPSYRQTNLFSGFLQDEVSIISDELKLTLGAKFEHNDQTGLEALPNGRILWNASQNLTFWGAISKAVAPPAIFFEDSRIPLAAFPIEGSPFPGIATAIGSRDLESESLIAYEIGGRGNITDNFSIDLALFYNHYDNVFSSKQGEPFVDLSRLSDAPALIVPLYIANELGADSYGGEITSEFIPSDNWRLILAYGFMKLDVDLNQSGDISTSDAIETGSPQHQLSLRSLYSLSESIEFDGDLRFVDSLSNGEIPSYLELNLRVNFELSDQLDLSIIGQNLLEDSHLEAVGDVFGPPKTEIERGVYAEMRYIF